MTTINCRLFLLHIIIFSFLHSSAQVSRLNNIKNNIIIASTPLAKLQATLEFCDQWESFSPDTLYKYALLAKQLAANLKDSNAIIMSDYYLAAYLFQKNKVDSSLKAIDSVIAVAKNRIPYNDTTLKFWMLRGNILQRTSHYSEVLRQDLSLMNLAEMHNDTVGLIRLNTGIGNVNLRLKNNEEALKWHYNATALMRTDELKIKCSFVYINIAVVYYHLASINDTRQNEDSIEINLQKAIQYSRKGSSLTNLANSLSMYGNVLAEYKKVESAEAVLKEALETRQSIGDIFYVISDMVALSAFYENSNNNAKALEICLQALNLAKANGSDFSSINVVYGSLGEIYSNQGDYKNYSEVLKEKMQLQDSMYKVNTAEEIAQLEARYDVEKKQNTIIQQQYDLVKKNYLLYGSIALLLLGTVFSFILFWQNKKKQQLKLQMLHEEEQRMSAIAVERAEEHERSRIAAELHDNLGSQLSYISSNIDFLLDAPMQQSDEEKNVRLLKLNEAAKNTITDLRETIWALKKESVKIEELADRLKLYAKNQLSHKLNMKLNVVEKLDENIILSPAEALNIFRILQEAINNAVKYSDANELVLSITSGLPLWYHIFLKDNGKGFNINASLRGHYGLENMRERAREIQIKLEITSAQDIGTTVLLSKM